MANNAGKSLLLSCAPEIRNIIYGHVLTYDSPITPRDPGEEYSIFLALLLVCKSVEREAAPIFYERNLFRFLCQDSGSGHNLDENNQVRAEERLSSNDDAQTTSTVIEVPKRHINSLRRVSLICEPPALSCHGPVGEIAWILDLEKTIDFLAARNAILSSLSITLERVDRHVVIQWNPDPSTFLRELDAERRISTAVGKLANLRRLEITHFRVALKSAIPLKKVPTKCTAEALNLVKVNHFAKAKAILYTCQTEQKTVEENQTAYYLTEEYLIDLQLTSVLGRKLEDPGEREREGGDDGRANRME